MVLLYAKSEHGLRLVELWTLIDQSLHVDTIERPVVLEHIQRKPPMLEDISLPNFHHLAALGHALPRSMEEFARKRVENNVDASAICSLYDSFVERNTVGVEYSLSWNAVMFD